MVVWDAEYRSRELVERAEEEDEDEGKETRNLVEEEL